MMLKMIICKVSVVVVGKGEGGNDVMSKVIRFGWISCNNKNKK